MTSHSKIAQFIWECISPFKYVLKILPVLSTGWVGIP